MKDSVGNWGSSTSAGVFALVCLLLSGAHTAHAQQSPAGQLLQFVVPTQAKDRIFYHQSKDWFVECTYDGAKDASRCELSTGLFDKGGAVDANYSIQIVMADKKAPPVAILRTPLDLHLSKGVDLQVDKRFVGRLTYRSCHKSGCVVPFSMIGMLNRRLLGGNRATFELHDLVGKKLGREMSLLGISNAYRVARNFF